MTPFMVSAYCCGEIDSAKSLPIVSNRVVAAAGGSAWSHDCANTLALLETS